MNHREMSSKNTPPTMTKARRPISKKEEMHPLALVLGLDGMDELTNPYGGDGRLGDVLGALLELFF
jgi:hypothetical protein